MSRKTDTERGETTPLGSDLIIPVASDFITRY
jgi:hypothetical protein